MGPKGKSLTASEDGHGAHAGDLHSERGCTGLKKKEYGKRASGTPELAEPGVVRSEETAASTNAAVSAERTSVSSGL